MSNSSAHSVPTLLATYVSQLPDEEALQSLLSSVEDQPVTVTGVAELDIGVNSVQTGTGKKWVVRSFSSSTPFAAIEQVAEILHFVAEHNFPAERLAERHSTSVIDGKPILVTEFIPGVRAKGDKNTTRELGRLLGVLHTLPYTSSPKPKRGGAWHHVVPAGGVAEEVTASKGLLEPYASGPDETERSAVVKISDVLNSFLAFESLPHALVHPDFVSANAINTEDGRILLVDWVGSGLGPRIWPLGFLLLAVSYRSIKLVDVVLHAYKKFVRLEKEEITLLPVAIVSRWLVIGCWEVSVGRKKPSDILKEHEERVVQANTVFEQAKPIVM